MTKSKELSREEATIEDCKSRINKMFEKMIVSRLEQRNLEIVPEERKSEVKTVQDILIRLIKCETAKRLRV